MLKLKPLFKAMASRFLIGSLALSAFYVLCMSQPITQCTGVPQPAGGILILSPVLPVDVEDPDPDFKNVHNPAKIPESQRKFDLFSWRMFIGLNWPAKEDGSADPD